jgi:hypothetical protein
MAGTESPKTTPHGWLRKFLASFSLEWIVHTVDLVYSVYHFAIDGHHAGMYEIWEYDSTLELQDPHGKNAILHKHQRV